MSNKTIAELVKTLHKKTIERMLEALDDPETQFNAALLREVRGLLKDNGVDDPMVEELLKTQTQSFKPLPFTDPDETPLKPEDIKNLG